MGPEAGTVARGLEVGEPSGHGRERHLRLEPGQGGAEAVVGSERERQVSRVRAVEVEAVGIAEPASVAVRRGALST